MLLLILCGLLCTFFYYYCIRPLNYWKKRGVKQHSPVWFFGDNFHILFRTETFYDSARRWYNEHLNERYSGIYQLMLPTLLVRDPELIKQIGVKQFDHFLDHRTFIPDNADPLWSRNLFALRGQRWREMRPVLSPAFTSSKMKGMFNLMSEVADTFISYFKEKGNDVNEIEMKENLVRYGNDVIASVAFGINVNSMKDKNNEFFLMGKEATDFTGFFRAMVIFGYTMFPKLYEFLKVSLFSKEVTKFFLDLVENTIKIREEKGIVRPDMIHLLMEARKGEDKHEVTTNVETGFATVDEINHEKASEFHKRNITNIDIAAQALIFFFAGFDSVTNIMSFMAYELALNPEIQNRLRDEINKTHQECNGKLTYEALMKMKYLDMVVSETLRKWPNFLVIDRVCTKPYTIQPTTPNERPIELKKGDVIWIPVCGIHYDPKYYPEPEKFDPERFSDENKHNINPYTYLPFGVGPRNCIGSRFALLECKTLYYLLLLNFELVPIKKTNIPLKLSKRSFNIMAESGNWLGLKPIKK